MENKYTNMTDEEIDNMTDEEIDNMTPEERGQYYTERNTRHWRHVIESAQREKQRDHQLAEESKKGMGDLYAEYKQGKYPHSWRLEQVFLLIDNLSSASGFLDWLDNLSEEERTEFLKNIADWMD